MRPQFIALDEVTNIVDYMEEHQNAPTVVSGELDEEIARQERIAEIVEDGEVKLSEEEQLALYKKSLNRKGRRQLTKMEQLKVDLAEANRLEQKTAQKRRDQRRRAKASRKLNRKR